MTMKLNDRELYRLNQTSGPVHGSEELREAAEKAGFTVSNVSLRPSRGVATEIVGWEFVVHVTEWPSESCDECGQMVSPATHSPVKGIPGALQCNQ